MADRVAPEGIAIVGPTAAGKTDAGILVAEALGTEIIGCDSRQVYRRLEIGTAKPTAAQLLRVPHHLVDIAEPDERFSAGRYKDAVLDLLPRLASSRHTPLFVGGTGLYLRAASLGLHPAPPGSADFRRWLESLAGTIPGGLCSLLEGVDPEAASRIHPNDRYRLSRALEFYFLEGETQTGRLRRERGRPPLGRVLVFGIAAPPAELRGRIDDRLAHMVDLGLEGEVRDLLARGWDESLPALRAVGYPQFASHVRGESTLDEAIAETRRATWQYARRQMTWFRSIPAIVWLDGAGNRSSASLADEILERLRGEGIPR